MLRDLVFAAAAINGGTFSNLGDCQAGFRDLWGLDVEIDELRAVRDHLAEEGAIDSGAIGFRLQPEIVAELEERARQSSETEAAALDDWRSAIASLRPDLTENEFNTLRADLDEWLARIIIRHGVEAALMLYPEDDRAQRFFEEIDARGMSFLPARAGVVGAIREEALRLFVRSPTPAQRTYLANRLNTAFYLTVLTLDPQAEALVQATAKGRRVYLDTNFLYAVLGKAPTAEVVSATRLLELTSNMGIELAVTPWTVEELRKSIQNAQRNAERSPLRPELAQLMLKVTGEKGYGHAFWEEYRRSGVRPEDWFGRAMHFETDLQKLGINTVSEGCDAVEKDKEHMREYCSLLDRVLMPHDRHSEVVEHDVKHRMLIERLRGKGTITFSNARFWYLTQDTKLPHFALVVPDPSEERPALPFCISPSAWLQVVRALTPRTEDFDETVVTLLATPYVGYRAPVDQRAVREVVARMDVHDDASPELALAVLEDTDLVHAIVDARDTDQVEAQVRAAFSTKAAELEAEAKASQVRAAAALAQKDAAETRREEAIRDLGTEVRRRKALEDDLEREREERLNTEHRLASEIADLRSAVDEERAVRDAMQAAATARKRRNRRTLFGVLFSFAAAAVGLVVGLLPSITSVYVLGAIAAGTFCLVLVGVRIVAGQRWGGEIVNWVFGIATVLGLAAAIVAIAITAD